MLGLGDGGFVVGCDVMATGAATGAVCKTDVGGAYYWNGENWRQLYSYQSLKNNYSPNAAIAGGCWEIRIGPTDANYVYMTAGTPDAVKGTYAVFVSRNKGLVWDASTLTFTAEPLWWGWAQDIPNSGGWRFSAEKIVVDPLSNDVAYAGIPTGCSLSGTHTGEVGGVYRTVNAGASWERITDIPASVMRPGHCGMCIDINSPTATLFGKPVKSRVIIPSGGYGVYESLNGGATFTRTHAEPTTPPTPLTVTTTHADSIIVVAAWTWQQGTVQNITDDGGLVWHPRFTGNHNNDWNLGYLWSYWAKAPTGTYHINVNYRPGNISKRIGYQIADFNPKVYGDGAATFTATVANDDGSHEGGILTVTAMAAGSIEVGHIIQGGGGQVFNMEYNADNRIVSQISGTTGQTGTYRLKFYNRGDAVTPATYKTYKPVTNQVVAFVVTGADQTAPFVGSPQWDFFGQFRGATTGIATSGVSLPFSVSVIGEPNTGFTRVGNYDYQFCVSISNAPLPAGGYNPQAGATWFNFADAIMQASGRSIALDGTPVYANSGPFPDTLPANVTGGQMSHDGTYWCITGPECGGGNPLGASGGLWRYKNIAGTWTWQRMDGSYGGVGAFQNPNTPGAGGLWGPTPGYNATGSALVVDPRAGFEGSVSWFTNKAWNGAHAPNANAVALQDIQFHYHDSDANILQTMTSPVGALNWGGGVQYVGNNGPQVGYCVIDAITGYHWLASGAGMVKITTWAPGGPIVAENNSQGIEEMLVQDFCTPPGKGLLVAVQDQMVMPTSVPGYADSWPLGVGSCCWSIDYAADNPNHVVAAIHAVPGEPGGYNSSYSNDGGITWTKFVSEPCDAGVGGGCISCVQSTGNVVVIPWAIYPCTPRYGDATGTTWTDCNGCPQGVVYIGSYWTQSRVLAAARDGSAKVWLYAPVGDGTRAEGIYRSTDGGVNFTRTPGQPADVPANNTFGMNGYTLYTVPGYPDHLWFSCQFYYAASSNQIWHSEDGGNTWVKVNPGSIGVIYMAIGRAMNAGGYPRIFKRQYVNGSYMEWFASDDKCVTWTSLGKEPDVFPQGAYLTYPTFARGDWNMPGRLYVGFGQNGAIYYNPPSVDYPSNILANAGTPGVAAHSTARRLVAGYNGPAFRLMEWVNDGSHYVAGTEQDFYFEQDGDAVNNAAVFAYRQAHEHPCLIRIYDQYGNTGNDIGIIVPGPFGLHNRQQ